MPTLLSKWVRRTSSRSGSAPQHWQPSFDVLEDRTVPAYLTTLSVPTITLEGNTAIANNGIFDYGYTASAVTPVDNSNGMERSRIVFSGSLTYRIDPDAGESTGDTVRLLGDVYTFCSTGFLMPSASCACDVSMTLAAETIPLVHLNTVGGEPTEDWIQIKFGDELRHLEIGDEIRVDFSVDINFPFEWVYPYSSQAAYAFDDSLSVVRPTPDLKVLDATATASSGFQNLSVTYAVENEDVSSNFVVRAYLSADADFQEGFDQQLPGQLVITPTDGKAGKTYAKLLKLGSVPTITLNQRFIIVVVDADNAIAESDEDNNTMFAIPLFKPGEKGGFNPGTSTFQFGIGEAKASGPINARIAGGTADYTRLSSISETWSAVGGVFKQEESDPYKPDDVKADGQVATSLSFLTALIDLARQQAMDYSDRFTVPQLMITDAFDQEGEHGKRSLHYEGRALDFRGSGTSLQRLAGLALLAGFNWVHNETNHLHVSSTGTPAEFSFTALSDALEWGSQNGLVPNAAFKTKLASLLQQGTKQALNSFRAKLDGAPATKIKPKLRDLLLFNANALFATLP